MDEGLVWPAWDDYQSRFRLSDEPAASGRLSVGPTTEDSAKAYNYIVESSSWDPPASVGIDSAGDLYVESDLEAGGVPASRPVPSRTRSPLS